MKRQAFTLSRLVAWLRSLRAASLARAAAKRKAVIRRESERAVQVREFGGDICLCLHGVPVLNLDCAWGDPAEVVQESRKVWMAWREKEAEHGRG